MKGALFWLAQARPLEISNTFREMEGFSNTFSVFSHLSNFCSLLPSLQLPPSHGICVFGGLCCYSLGLLFLPSSSSPFSLT
ncbi:hypothetical protein A2U01_0050732, partial [Trifolium medium]|nr:hypothetical protein [Trifolium medium]